MTDVEPAAATPNAVDRNALRAELEATRAAYHELLDSLSEEDWRRKSANPAWRVGQLMWHLAWALGYFPKGVDQCRKGDASNMPAWILNPLNMLNTRIGSRKATPVRVAKLYDRNHAAVLACLDGVQDDEWHKRGKPLGAFGEEKTVESVFRSIAAHFQEHEADIKKGLGEARQRRASG